jgi:hypothetical protein
VLHRSALRVLSIAHLTAKAFVVVVEALKLRFERSFEEGKSKEVKALLWDICRFADPLTW